VAVEIPLCDDTLLAHDERAEEAFEHALLAWRAARARIETVDPTRLSPAGRAAYFHLIARIGLWSDARMGGCDDPDATEEDQTDVV
jgi:hypothetical protein